MLNLVINGFKFENQIGAGSFANVYSAIHLQTGLRVCIKVFDKTETSEDTFMNEVHVFEKLAHPCIVSLDTYFQDHDYYYIVMEHARGDTLLNFINSAEGSIKLSVIRYVSAQLISVMYYLHNVVKIAHRDIKLENIIIDSSFNIKLIDFGLSKELNTDGSLLTTICGSEAYIAPELVNMKEYSNSADIWSVGVVIYALSVGALPFYDDNTDRMYHMIKYQEPFFPGTINKDLQYFLNLLLTKDQEKRPSAAELFNIKFIADSLDKRILSDSFYKNYTWSARLSGPARYFYSSELEKLGYKFNDTYEKILKGINDESTAALKIICTAKEIKVQKLVENKTEPTLTILSLRNKAHFGNKQATRLATIFAPHRKAIRFNKNAHPYIYK